MIKLSVKFKKKIAIMFLIISLLRCGAYPDLAEAPGTCFLNCQTAIIGSTEMRIRLLNDGTSLTCEGIGDAPYNSIVPVRFVVERKKLPEEMSNPENLEEYVPVPGISFESLILGGQMSPQKNPSDSRDKYDGILTPMDDWCSDSCGVGSIDIVPMCTPIGINTVTILVHSGSLSATATISVVPLDPIVSDEDEDEDE